MLFRSAIGGYTASKNSLELLAKDEEYFGLDKINKEKLAIRFECKALDNA